MARKAAPKTEPTRADLKSARSIFHVRQDLFDFRSPLSNSSTRHKDLFSGFAIKGVEGTVFEKIACKIVSIEDKEMYCKGVDVSQSLLIGENKISSLAIIDVFYYKITASEFTKAVLKKDGFFKQQETDEETSKFFTDQVITDSANLFIQNVLVCANIARTDSFNLISTLTKGEDKAFFSPRNNESPLGDLKGFEDKKGMRVLREQRFIDVWDWFHLRKGVFVGQPECDIDRALSCFSSMFVGEREITGARDLLLSFAGLEAILAENESGIVSQLRSKLVALLGTQVDVKGFDKQVRDMYEYRSQIIHGKESIITALRSSIFLEGFRRHSKSDDALMAKLLLVAVIQYCAQNRCENLLFQTVLVPGAP